MLDQLPVTAHGQIIDRINDLDDPQITVTVSKRKLKPEDEFVFYFCRNMNELIKDPGITKQDLAVLFKYADRMKYGNQLSISQIDIAEELQIDKSKVSKSVKKLIERGVFYKQDRSLYMNWQYLAKGNLTDFIQAEAEKKKTLQHDL